MKHMITIIAISGSLKSTSANTNILREIAKIAPENVNIKIVEGLDQLPHFNPEIAEDIHSVTHFRNQIKAANGVVFSTPEYAFGVPGVLKNALDWLVSSGELNDKAVAAISASPIHTGGEKALASLLLTLSALGTNTPQNASLAVGNIKSKMNEAGEITNPETLQELKEVLSSLLESIHPK
jgi:chromate reductase